MQRQRDDMASRFSLSKAIIDEYRTAFTGAMQLTSLFNSLKDKTEKRTVTEVTKGVIKLGEELARVQHNCYSRVRRNHYKGYRQDRWFA
jgi:hypothetical protein